MLKMKKKNYFLICFYNILWKIIPCISLKGQKIFHTGYELREKDKHDILILENL